MLEKILEFWFGALQDGMSPSHKRRLWYASSSVLDAKIRQDFKDVLLDAAAGKYSLWQSSPRGQLALILLFDQFSRNIFRGQAQAFAYDPLALDTCLSGIEKGSDRSLCLIERVFFYHPLEHSEELIYQELCVKLFEVLSKEVEGEQQQFINNSLKFVHEHRDIVARFGRFPHRNKVLGRDSTAQELDYLGSGGKRFGQ
jgi:uncharacterized protein (DUF924 family)